MGSATERGGSFGRTAADALAFAEAEGAAPGAEYRGFGPVESSPLDRSTRRSVVRRGLAALAAAFVLAGLWHGGQAAYLHAKAGLGQRLLLRAWEEARQRGTAVKPWPWADTHPVARLRAPAQNVDLLVLEGANDRTLAWGPAHLAGSAAPGARGNAIVTGHRDTHFAFLRDVKPGDPIDVETAAGATRRYRVERTFVADRRALRLPADERAATLALVTCFPFDAIDPGTPLRYAVVARAEPRSLAGLRRLPPVAAARPRRSSAARPAPDCTTPCPPRVAPACGGRTPRRRRGPVGGRGGIRRGAGRERRRRDDRRNRDAYARGRRQCSACCRAPVSGCCRRRPSNVAVHPPRAVPGFEQ